MQPSWLGAPEVLVYDAGAFHVASVLDLEPATFEAAWRTNCLGGFLCAREVLPAMLERGRGTLLFSGATASLRGGARFAGLGLSPNHLHEKSDPRASTWPT